jgi:hypothetical protein
LQDVWLSSKSGDVLDCLVTHDSVMTVTRCTTNGRLGWHAGPVTGLCEAHPTTLPTFVVCMFREGAHGLCQQDGV